LAAAGTAACGPVVVGPVFCFLLVLAGWHTVAGGRDTAGIDAGAVGRTVAVALVLVVPWLVLNATADRSLVRLEAVAADLSPYPRGLLHEQMAYYHQTTGNQDEVARHYRRAGEVCPANLRFHAIYGTYLLNQGELAAASAAYDRALAADSTYAYGLKMAVTARVLRQDYAAALPLARRQFRLGYQDAAGAENHAVAAENAGQQAEAIRAYRRAAALNPSRLDLLERAAGLYLAQHQYGPAEELFRRLLASDSPRTQVGLGLADAIWWDFMAQPDRRPATENRARLDEVLRLVDAAQATMAAAGNGTASLQAWRDEVHLRLVDISE